jgi:putative glutamine amidotransferase
MSRPLIGITAYAARARWGVWDRDATLVPQAYVACVHRAGGRPVVLPPSADGAEETVAALHGLVLAGGADLAPSLYGAVARPATRPSSPDRDTGESALLAAAVAADLPLLGICRGMQLMVAAAGGALIQHLPDVLGEDRHRGGVGVHSRHHVETVPGTRLAGLIGPRIEVPSYHHQGIASPGSLTVNAYADDGTVEGVEDPAARFRVGVLWHPEHDPDRALFAALIQTAAAPTPTPAPTPLLRRS